MNETPRQTEPTTVKTVAAPQLPQTPEGLRAERGAVVEQTACGVHDLQHEVEACAATQPVHVETVIASAVVTTTESADALVTPQPTEAQQGIDALRQPVAKEIKEYLTERPDIIGMLRATVESYREPVDARDEHLQQTYGLQLLRLAGAYEARLEILASEQLAGVPQPTREQVAAAVTAASEQVLAAMPTELGAIARLDGVGNRISWRDFENFYRLPQADRLRMTGVSELPTELVGVGGMPELRAAFRRAGMSLDHLATLTPEQVTTSQALFTTHFTNQLSLYARGTPTQKEADAALTELTLYYTQLAGQPGSKISHELIRQSWETALATLPENSPLRSHLLTSRVGQRLDRTLATTMQKLAEGKTETPLTEAYRELQEADHEAEVRATYNPTDRGLAKNWNLHGLLKVAAIGWGSLAVFGAVIKQWGDHNFAGLLTNPSFLAGGAALGYVWWDGKKYEPDMLRPDTLTKDLPAGVRKIADDHPSLVPWLRAVDSDMLTRDALGIEARIQAGRSDLDPATWTRLPDWAELQKKYKLPDPATLTATEQRMLFRALSISRAAGTAPRNIRDFPSAV